MRSLHLAERLRQAREKVVAGEPLWGGASDVAARLEALFEETWRAWGDRDDEKEPPQ